MQRRRFDAFLSYNHADGDAVEGDAVEGIARRLAAVPTVGYAYSGPLSPDVGLQIVFQGLILWLLAAGVAWPAYGRLRPR